MVCFARLCAVLQDTQPPAALRCSDVCAACRTRSRLSSCFALPRRVGQPSVAWLPSAAVVLMQAVSLRQLLACICCAFPFPATAPPRKNGTSLEFKPVFFSQILVPLGFLSAARDFFHLCLSQSPIVRGACSFTFSYYFATGAFRIQSQRELLLRCMCCYVLPA